MARLVFSKIDMADKVNILKEASIYIGKSLRFVRYIDDRQELEAEGQVDEEDVDFLRVCGYDVVLK